MIYYSWGQVSNDATICESPILFKSVLLSVGFWCCSWLMCWGMNLLCSVLQQRPLPSTDCRYGKKPQLLKTRCVDPTSKIKPLKTSDLRCSIDWNFNELWYPILGKQNLIQQKKIQPASLEDSTLLLPLAWAVQVDLFMSNNEGDEMSLKNGIIQRNSGCNIWIACEN